MSNRQERLREYARPLRAENWQGASSDPAYIDRWSKRATKESQIAPRALGPVHGGPLGTKDEDLPSLPNTGKQTDNRPTGMSPRTSRKVDAAMRGEDPGELNHVGSSYMRDVRRTT